MNKFYITTSIAYTSAGPHLGFALEVIQADVIARMHRLAGYDVFFLTGTDEHGLKIFRRAKENNLTPQEFVDQTSQLYQFLNIQLDISNNDFIRTTDQTRHWPAAQKLWKILYDKKLLEKKQYSGLYCVSCEKFISENELTEEGNCPIHDRKPEHQQVENYFFKLSQFNDRILKAIKSDELKILPETRKNEIMQVLENGLEDVSFSREKSQMPWGIPVPNDPDHVMYVWCDALTNYISALGYAEDSAKFKKYWPADLHCIGKDIIRFHAAIWSGMLLAADLPLPKNILVHGFIHSGGQRMSKTIGNVIDPSEISDRLGSEALRFILLKEIPVFGDGDLTTERIDEVYQAELANKLGNLLSRVTGMFDKYSELINFDLLAKPTQKTSPEIEYNIAIPQIHDYLMGGPNQFQLDKYLAETWQIVEKANKYIEETKPWELSKNISTDQTKIDFSQIFFNLFETIRIIGLLLEPVSPATSRKILAAIKQSGIDSSINNSDNEENFQKLLQWGLISSPEAIEPAKPLFPRIE